MKLAISTLGCAERSLEAIADCAARFGIRGIEIRGVEGVMSAPDILCFSEQKAGESKKLLSDKQLQLVCLGTSCAFHDKNKLDSALAEGREAVSVCRRMGIPAIRVFGNRIMPPEAPEEIIERVGGAIGELCAFAAPPGVSVLVEVHGDFNTSEALLPVIELNRKHPNFGLIWDVAHSDRVYGPGWRSFYDSVKPYIRHVHIKDHIRAGAGGKTAPTLIGEGEIPLPNIIRVN